MLGMILSILFIVLVSIKILIHSWKKLDIPEPEGHPLLGHLYRLNQNAPYVQFQQWAKKCGSIFKIRLLNKEYVILNDYESIQEALVKKSNDFAGRTTTWRSLYATKGGRETLVFHQFDEEFKTLKKVGHKALKQYGDGMDRIIKLALEEIGWCVDKFKQQNQQPFDPRQTIHKCICNIMTALIIGDNLAQESDDFKTVEFMLTAGESLNTTGAELDVFPWLRFFGHKVFKNIEQHIETRKQLFSKWIEEYRKQLKENKELVEGTIMHTLVQSYDNGTITHHNLIGALNETLIAGIITTASTLSGFMLVLINEPEAQKKMHDEIDSVIGHERQPSMEDQKNMPYTEAAILEAVRYTTTTTLSIPHSTVCDTTIGSYHLPKGTEVWTNLWALHHDERYFAEPNKYRPEHFLDAEGNIFPPGERQSFLPFGAGRRVCLGEALAKDRLFLFVTSLLQQVDILPAEKHNIPDPDPTKFKYAITNEPGPFKIIAKPRQLE